MKVSYDMSSNVYGYGNQSTSQTSSKPFIIPAFEQTQESKVSSKVESSLSVPLTYIGYDKFDPFGDMAKTGGFKIPDFMQTKTTPTRNDAEILKEMEELAMEHARTGTLQKDDKKFAELMDEYISSVSPDRDGILKSKISEILGRIESEMAGMDSLENKEKYELIDYLIELLDFGKKGNKNCNEIINEMINNAINAMAPESIATSNAYSDNDIIETHSDGYYTEVVFDRGWGNMSMKGDMYDNVFVKNGAVEYANFYDENGENIMCYDSSFGLLQKYTKAEGERMQEIIGVYNAAYDIACGNYSDYNGNSIYNSTYERLKSEAALSV